jgi:predicted nucleotidyltransferase
MDKERVLDIIARFKKVLEKKGIKPDRIILYGSWAAGTPVPGSDIDLVVISEGFKGKGFWERIDILSDAIYEVFEPIEAVALTPEEWERGDSAFVELAKKDAVILE